MRRKSSIERSQNGGVPLFGNLSFHVQLLTLGMGLLKTKQTRLVYVQVFRQLARLAIKTAFLLARIGMTLRYDPLSHSGCTSPFACACAQRQNGLA